MSCSAETTARQRLASCAVDAAHTFTMRYAHWACAASASRLRPLLDPRVPDCRPPASPLCACWHLLQRPSPFCTWRTWCAPLFLLDTRRAASSHCRLRGTARIVSIMPPTFYGAPLPEAATNKTHGAFSLYRPSRLFSSDPASFPSPPLIDLPSAPQQGCAVSRGAASHIHLLFFGIR